MIKTRALLFLNSIVLFFLGAGATSHAYHQKNIVVFVHGTTLPITGIFDPINFLRGKAGKYSFYRRGNRMVRNFSLLTAHSGIQLSDGLTAIAPTMLKEYGTQSLLPHQRHFGTYHTLYAYHELEKYIYNDQGTSDLFCFGWSGLLNHEERLIAGKKLYESLVSLQAQYDTPTRITLVAFSYGGQVALNMAKAHDAMHQNIHIHRLITYGVPLQIRTLPLAHNTLFGSIFNIYSHGDSIQLKDRFSAGGMENFRTFAEMGSYAEHIYDIALAFNGDTHTFDHQRFNLIGYPFPVIPALS